MLSIVVSGAAVFFVSRYGDHSRPVLMGFAFAAAVIAALYAWGTHNPRSRTAPGSIALSIFLATGATNVAAAYVGFRLREQSR